MVEELVKNQYEELSFQNNEYNTVPILNEDTDFTILIGPGIYSCDSDVIVYYNGVTVGEASEVEEYLLGRSEYCAPIRRMQLIHDGIELINALDLREIELRHYHLKYQQTNTKSLDLCYTDGFGGDTLPNIVEENWEKIGSTSDARQNAEVPCMEIFKFSDFFPCYRGEYIRVKQNLEIKSTVISILEEAIVAERNYIVIDPNTASENYLTSSQVTFIQGPTSISLKFCMKNIIGTEEKLDEIIIEPPLIIRQMQYESPNINHIFTRDCPFFGFSIMQYVDEAEYNPFPSSFIDHYDYILTANQNNNNYLNLKGEVFIEVTPTMKEFIFKINSQWAFAGETFKCSVKNGDTLEGNCGLDQAEFPDILIVTEYQILE